MDTVRTFDAPIRIKRIRGHFASCNVSGDSIMYPDSNTIEHGPVAITHRSDNNF